MFCKRQAKAHESAKEGLAESNPTCNDEDMCLVTASSTQLGGLPGTWKSPSSAGALSAKCLSGT
eukprot:scaffold462498_cov18-Prasinocladus_malaysianus.AAC.1